ncbi:major facilitator superfamily domain-containing protein [Apiosordaria backusii]|uniref:Major facilitator superfamily domain-containing protein n=1 Tax=Apiosordaria backusii TaxID=314023 RepID=A0AA40E788_9PEZI|nr:major facilitator superfamily domain-containing protein [Apiosordaria backusii]
MADNPANPGQQPAPPASAVLDFSPMPVYEEFQTDSSSPLGDTEKQQTPTITTSPIDETPPVNHYRIAALSLASFTEGLTDSSIGPLIEPMKTFYNLPNDTLISLLFVSQALGFILGAAFLPPSAPSNPSPTTTTSPSSPPTSSFNLAIGNVYCGSLKTRPTFYLGVMHACYGLGATIGPLIATGMIVQTRISYGVGEDGSGGVVAVTTTTEKKKKTPGSWIKSHLHLDSKLVFLACLFIFFYQGAEVSNSGWTTEYLYEQHPASQAKKDTYGYVMTGFWAGVTLGRVLLTPLGEKFPGGNKVFVYLLVVLCAGFQLLIWLVPNLIGRGVAVALAGLCIGPGYPCAMRVVMELMEERESEDARRDDGEKEDGKTGAMAVISAFGMSGGAAMPYIIGNLNEPVGRWVMHPIVLALCALMVIVWFFLPGSKTREREWQPRKIHRFVQFFF